MPFWRDGMPRITRSVPKTGLLRDGMPGKPGSVPKTGLWRDGMPGNAAMDNWYIIPYKKAPRSVSAGQ